jgi:hypothetical protein
MKLVSQFKLRSAINFKLILILFALVAIVRIIYHLQLPVLFFFDQARDLLIVKDLVVNLDPKLLGPSASGTNDTIYHGVFYYYFLAPLYLISAGNPQIIQNLLGIVLSLTVLPIFILVKKITSSNLTAVITIILYAFSSDAAIHGTWLSNPSLATLTIPSFLFFTYMVFIEGKQRYFWLAGLFLALSIQSVIFTGYLILIIPILFFYRFYYKKNIRIIDFKNWIYFVLAFLSGVSTMILTQYKLYNAGIFTLEAIKNNFGNTNATIIDNLLLISIPYSEKLSLSLFPNNELVSVILFSLTFLFLIKNLRKKQGLFILTIFSLPAFFLLLIAKNSLHSLIGFEFLFILPLGFLISKTLQGKQTLSKVLGYVIILAYISMHALNIYSYSINRSYPPAVQPGMYLDDQIELIRASYELSNYEPFSISTFSNPYQYATTWIYLYDWYGVNEFGYKPAIARQDQIGMFGYNTLEQVENNKEIHFAIIEPSLNTPEFFLEQFNQQQELDNNELVSIKHYGSIKLEKWVK